MAIGVVRPALAAIMASRSAPATGRSAIEALEAERDFCLRSLQDLEAEHAAGDLDDTDYESLRDSYVARAAAALRHLGGGASSPESELFGAAGQAAPRPPDLTADGLDPSMAATPCDAGHETADRPDPAERAGTAPGVSSRKSWRKRGLVAAAVVVAAGAAAWGVVASSATRLPGQEITGQAVGSVAEAQALQAAQQAADRGDALTAVKDYQKVLNSDPNQPEALTGEGWLLVQTQQPALLQEGLQMLTAAERAVPPYAPAHVYRGIALLSEADYTGAIPELQWYLAHNPDPQLAPRVRTALAQAQAKAAAAKG